MVYFFAIVMVLIGMSILSWNVLECDNKFILCRVAKWLLITLQSISLNFVCLTCHLFFFGPWPAWDLLALNRTWGFSTPRPLNNNKIQTRDLFVRAIMVFSDLCLTSTSASKSPDTAGTYLNLVICFLTGSADFISDT